MQGRELAAPFRIVLVLVIYLCSADFAPLLPDALRQFAALYQHSMSAY